MPCTHEHIWEEITTDETKAATCTEDGLAVYKCKTCGAIEERTTNKLGHDWELKSDTATCTKDGVKTYKCSRCDETKTENIPAHHTFIAGGCDICGAYEHNKEDDYQIKAYVYSSVEDAKKDEKGENARVLYFSFPNDTTGIPQIVTIDGYLCINIDDLIQMKSGYAGKTVKYFNLTSLQYLLEDEYQGDPTLLTELKQSSSIYIVIE